MCFRILPGKLVLYGRLLSMGRKCCVVGCRSNYDSTNCYVSVFHFPSNVELKEKWIKFVSRKDWSPSKSSVVCAKHFLSSDIIISDNYTDKFGVHHVFRRKHPALRKNTYPTVFPDVSSFLSVKTPVLRKDKDVSSYLSVKTPVLRKDKGRSKTFRVHTLHKVEHEGQNSTTFNGVQQDSGNDVWIDLNMEVDEEPMSSVEFTDDEANEDSLDEEASVLCQNVEPSSIVRSNVIGSVNYGTSYFDDENGNLSNKRSSFVKNQSWENVDVEYDPDIKVKIEDDSSGIDTSRTIDSGQHGQLSETIQWTDIKQELNYEDEGSDSPSSLAYGSELTNHTHCQPYCLPINNLPSLSSHGVAHSMHMIRTSDSVVDGKSKTYVRKVHPMANSCAIKSEDCCLVCNVSCVITNNRKLHRLPFCKNCRKAYFYQLTRKNCNNICVNKHCSVEGTCRIDYRQGKMCPRCQHIKFLSVLKAAQKYFNTPFKNGLKQRSNCQKRDWPAIRDEILSQEALICQPVVLLKRLEVDKISAQGSLDIFNTIKEEPPNSTDSYW